MNTRVCILDYGSGNVRSVANMLEQQSGSVKVSNDSRDIRDATHVVLPGVGAFGAAMSKIHTYIPLDTLANEVRHKGKPFLGICVGMQVLASRGHEFGDHQGLGWLKGEVKKLETGSLPSPHVGWNDIDVKRHDGIFARFRGSPDFYFLHSYFFSMADPSDVVAECTYGITFPCALSHQNIHAVQFHPEKSQRAGRELISSFLATS